VSARVFITGLEQRVKKIVFVDDEPLVLEHLRALFRPMQGEWDMEFLSSGAQALARLSRGVVDVVVTDMRMPGMDGADLLKEVMRRHPGTVRILLSGQAEAQASLHCASLAHHYLTKPCEAAPLKAAIHRATALESSVKNQALKKLISEIEHLPTVPSLYVEIVEKLNDPQADIDDVAAIVSRDVGTTAQILKLVNSAHFALPCSVSTCAEAVQYLGVETIKSLVLSLHTFYQFAEVDEATLLRVRDHSLEVAAAARIITLAETRDHKLADETFVAAMLHDTGKLILLANFGDWRSRNKSGLEGLAGEEWVFDANHADFGGYLMGLWGLPPPVVEAIAHHHSPALSPAQSFNSLTAVHVANVLVRERNAGSGELPSAPLDEDYLSRLGLAQRVGTWRELITR